MNLTLGKEIAVSTSYIKSNPAVPIYKGEETFDNLFGMIYHIEIGFYEGNDEKVKEYIIIDFKEYELSSQDKEGLIVKAKEYCETKNIDLESKGEIFLLDNEEAESFVEKLFDNMKFIRGLTTKRG
ncbi:hypothetical protein [Tepidibacter formicigenes]|jgi:hypothetical protein|uniref:Uncharacterized protein n=1 Tax=Tepidibacter formicigenes DSM 15518 TaxID=1123349 RepID=A0A1M6MHT9_9FIRM|nr:hypothetical protein [Tepidibacter formicigenes]SHJ82956.1 hypothetical protein SAMN02744037_00948 [Tepidibacter formicigenes DSM 15518]